MAAHLHHRPRATDSGTTPDRSGAGTKLLISIQWALTLLGLFCLIGAAVVIAQTPDAWPM